MARSIQEFPWVQDGLSDIERQATDELAYIGVENIAHLRAAVAMPFLRTLDTADLLAIRAMKTLAYRDLLAGLLEHPTVRLGINDAQLTRIAAAGAFYDEVNMGKVLDPAQTTVETWSGSTALTPNLRISIVRASEGPPETTDAVTEAVEFVEQVMQLPLPTDHVVLVMDDAAVPQAFAGSNFGFAIAYKPEYEQPDKSWEWRRLQHGLVHEVAHYFWSGNADWMDEGLANTVEYLYGAEAGLSPGQLKPQRNDCEAHDLKILST